MHRRVICYAQLLFENHDLSLTETIRASPEADVFEYLPECREKDKLIIDLLLFLHLHISSTYYMLITSL